MLRNVQFNDLRSKSKQYTGATAMTEHRLDLAVIESLRKYDTPTVCNALELLDSGFMAAGFTVDPLLCAFPKLPPMVGFAKTSTMRAGRPGSRMGQAEIEFMESYLDYVAQGPGPKIAVVQDLDDRHRGRGAMWGEVNTTIHKVLGCVGAITNGSIRDLRMIAPDFQLLAGSVGPSHAFGHFVDFGAEASVAGLVIGDGDLVHADEHGAVVIPLNLAMQVPRAAGLIIRREKVVLDFCRAPHFSLDGLKKAMRESDRLQ
jgi:regulator of RNase E activity RraA